MKNLLITLSLLFFTSFALLAQKGTVRGKVVEDGTGVEVSFADVIVEGTEMGESTDLEGAFALQLDAGTYNLRISFLGFTDYMVSNVEVKAGEVNFLGEIRLIDESVQIGMVTVEATTIKNNEKALLTMQKKSMNLLDAVSAQTFSRTGDSDAAAAIKRVPGVSVEGGKHVFVRGLGDRYTKTLLNGMAIPGLDPDKNSVQMDIFPTNLLDNIVVYKNFSPDLPGDFTGGTVDIATKDFPEIETLNASVSIGFNPSMHFKNNFLTYEGGKLDFLGFDDGTRALPFDRDYEIPRETLARSDDELAAELEAATRSFNPQMGTEQTTNLLNHAYSISYGNQINTDNATWGYTVAGNYSNNSSHYEDAVQNQFKSQEAEDGIVPLPLEAVRLDNQNFSQEEIVWSALASGAVKFNGNKIRLGLFHSQNAVSTASDVTTINGDENPATLVRDYLEYSQRSVSNLFIGGNHALQDNGWSLDWAVSPSISKIDEPDNRYTGYESENGGFFLATNVGGEAARVFRQLNEFNINSKVDVTYDFNIKDNDSKIKFGFSNLFKDRNYYILDYKVNFKGNISLTGNPGELLQESTIWSQDNTIGSTFIEGDFQQSNTYLASQIVNATYVMHEMPITEDFKAIYGARVEQFSLYYTGTDATGQNRLDNEKVENKWDFLPSLSLVYALNDDMNLRASYSRTVARPSFKEKSVAQIEDRLSGGSFYGNIDILPSNIDNIDLRWEYFFGNAEMVSISGFAKFIKNPIELAPYQQGEGSNFYDPSIILPSNGGDTRILGLEIEARKNLAFITESLEGLSIGTNLTFAKSQVKMDEDERNINMQWLRDGQEFEDTRPMVGQSPYLVNLFMAYRAKELGTEANISYNVQGDRLVVIGLGSIPNLYELPFHGLNFKLSQKLGSDDKLKLSLSVNNILNQEQKMVYRAFGTDDTIFRQRKPGVAFSFGINYKFM